MIAPLGAERCVLTVRVTPKGGRDGIDGRGEDGAGRSFVKIRVAAPPENGAANKAVLALLAKRLGLPKSALSLVAGDTARVKRIEIDAAAQRVERALSLDAAAIDRSGVPNRKSKA